MTTQTRFHPLSFPAPASRARSLARDAWRARRQRRHGPVLCAAMLCAGTLWADAAAARTSRPPRAASTPTTAQILAPSAATVPDALPPDKLIYRCGNTYSPQACGDAKPLDVQDARSDAQRLQSTDLTARDKRMAAWLEAERRGREAAASAPRQVAGAGSTSVCVDKPGKHCKPKAAPLRRVVSMPATASSATLAAKR
ncbi:MAG: hypothetical protein ABIR54_01505 [Burkholderiaceae bacterium]